MEIICTKILLIAGTILAGTVSLFFSGLCIYACILLVRSLIKELKGYYRI